MKSWKVLLGLGAACAACCAIPLLGVVGGLAAFGAALAACTTEMVPLAVLLLAGAGWAGLWWRRRQRACSCDIACSTDGPGACR